MYARSDNPYIWVMWGWIAEYYSKWIPLLFAVAILFFITGLVLAVKDMRTIE